MVRDKILRFLLLLTLVVHQRGGAQAAPRLPAEAAQFRVVANGAAAPEIWRVDASPRLTIGTVDGPACTLLNAVNSAAVTPSGHIVVASSQGGPPVLVFNSSGGCVGPLGRVGSGPGEFQISSVRVAPGGADTVYVFEGSPARRYVVHVFSVTRGYLRSSVAPRDSFSGFGRPGERGGDPVLLGGGGVLARTTPPDNMTTDGRGPIPARDSSAFVWLTPSLTVHRQLGRWATANAITFRFLPPSGGLGTYGMRAYQVSNTFAAADPGGRRLCMGDAIQPAISCYDAQGGGLTFTWSAPPIRVIPADARAWAAMPGMSPGVVNPGEWETFRRRIEVPQTLPFFAGIIVDSELNTWVNTYPPNPPDTSNVSYLVFTRDGTLRAKALIPSSVTVRQIQADYVLASRRDSLGVVTVVKLRLKKA